MNLLFFLGFLLAAAAAAANQLCRLSSSDILIDDTCYRFENSNLNYHDAQRYCHIMKMNVAIAKDERKWNFLASMAVTKFGITNGNFYIGLSRSNASSPFYWDDGTPLEVHNFGIMTPQNNVIELMHTSKWTTVNPTEPHLFICSYLMNATHS
ncbi:unnamed protein product [Caenorhabditis bovis]|uniref:C-type lectin domain-containing protein n=1 Tax=Caenorhabditis bovis TaxID=2654633 RepID=A0A8S1EZB1_9PELO|nr:unnamed protein product [Caenorhabditis bovis]